MGLRIAAEAAGSGLAVPVSTCTVPGNQRNAISPIKRSDHKRPSPIEVSPCMAQLYPEKSTRVPHLPQLKTVHPLSGAVRQSGTPREAPYLLAPPCPWVPISRERLRGWRGPQKYLPHT